MRKNFAVTLLTLGLLLTGCTSTMVETGTELNSKVPQSIDGYEYVSKELAESTGFCTGNPTSEAMNTEAEYVGIFYYSDSNSQLRPADGECNNRDFALSLTNGVVNIMLIRNNEIDQFGNQMQELIGDLCEPRDAYEDILACYFFINDSWITVTARQDGTEKQFRDKYQNLATKFAEQAEFGIK